MLTQEGQAVSGMRIDVGLPILPKNIFVYYVYYLIRWGSMWERAVTRKVEIFIEVLKKYVLGTQCLTVYASKELTNMPIL